MKTEPELASTTTTQKMERVDVLELENILLKVEIAIAPLIAKRDAIYAKYQIVPSEVGHTVGINFERAEFSRVEAKK